MSIKFDLDQVISQVGRDKGIDKNVLVTALESAVLSAAKKHYGHNRNLEAVFNPEMGEIEVLEFRTVVEQVTDPDTQMSLEDARREFEVDCDVGAELGRKLSSAELGRIAAQTAKQVIIQKLRDAERDIIYREFRDRKGELINGIVQRFERGNIIVNLGRTDAILPEREQIQKERYRQNDRIRAMILDIDPNARGPQIVLTRSHPEFMRKLFELEVPEIAEGIVEIRSIAREPGERAKIAVYSNDPSVDPEGACIGIKGSRVQAVVSELRGERVDIVTWSVDAPSFVAKALGSKDVLNVIRVIVDEEEHAMEVVVPDEQLALAIGRRGLNVKLASKLTGWRIDVRSESVAEEESKRARKALESIPGIGFGASELLYQEGYRSVKEVANALLEDLMAIDGLDAESASSILKGAQELAAQLGNEDETDEDGKQLTDVDQLVIDEDIRQVLIQNGYVTLQSLAEIKEEDLRAVTGLEAEQAQRVCSAVESFLRFQKSA